MQPVALARAHSSDRRPSRRSRPPDSALVRLRPLTLLVNDPTSMRFDSSAGSCVPSANARSWLRSVPSSSPGLRRRTFTVRPSRDDRRARRDEQRDTAISIVHRYNPAAVVVVGAPFGHTRPQWIVPYGGFMTVDGATKRLLADYR